MRAPAFLLLVLLPSFAVAGTLHVGTASGYAAPSLAIAAARDGDTILIQPGQYADCAFVRASNVTIEGVGPAAGVVIDGRPCGGKALLVIAGRDVTVRNLTLAGAHVPDGNGAGIRAEGLNLTVDGVRFIGNEDGILGAAPASSTILVENSLFERNGSCVAACAHGIYANRIALLRVVHSRFSGTVAGHDIKSRAARTEILDNEIVDGPDGSSSYLIEAPNGGACPGQSCDGDGGDAAWRRDCRAVVSAVRQDEFWAGALTFPALRAGPLPLPRRAGEETFIGPDYRDGRWS
jgi:hypothetical protein